IRFSSIGDIILTSPVIRVLREKFPDARIDMVVKQEYAELVSTNPRLDHIYTFDKKTGLPGLLSLIQQVRSIRYDLILDLHRNLRSSLLYWGGGAIRRLRYCRPTLKRALLVYGGINLYKEIVPVPDLYFRPLKKLGLANDGKGLELWPTPGHQGKATALLLENQVKDSELLIGFSPMAAHTMKRWEQKGFITLGVALVERYGARIVIFGGKDDRARGEEIARAIPHNPVVACGKLSLLESAALIGRCYLLVTNDTGVMHMGVAMKRKVVALFGPTSEELGFYPYYTEYTVISKALDCKPCTSIGTNICKKGTHACMKSISYKEVLAAVERLLK
ncbi:MAG: glycosyltransferase family 9 protein, partial [Nitrospira sp.]|nr:glycosyltransferase family 9 protein [Nitrospira sp.]